MSPWQRHRGPASCSSPRPARSSQWWFRAHSSPPLVHSLRSRALVQAHFCHSGPFSVIASPFIVTPSAAEESQNVILGPSRFHAKRTCMYSAATFSNRFRFLGCARKDTSVSRNDAAARRWAWHYVNRPWSTVGIYVRPESVWRLATSRAASSSKNAFTASAAPAGLAMCGQFPTPLILA